jgi:hypothetical protein
LALLGLGATATGPALPSAVREGVGDGNVADFVCGQDTPAAAARAYLAMAQLAEGLEPDSALLLSDLQHRRGEPTNPERFFNPTWDGRKTRTHQLVGSERNSAECGHASYSPVCRWDRMESPSVQRHTAPN